MKNCGYLLIFIWFLLPAVGWADATSTESGPATSEAESPAPVIDDLMLLGLYCPNLDQQSQPASITIRTQSKGGVATRDFLTALMTKFIDYSQENIDKAGVTEYCLDPAQAKNADCNPLKEVVRTTYIPKIKEARNLLALAQSNYDRYDYPAYQRPTSLLPNQELHEAPNGSKSRSWQNLSAEENAKATQLLTQEFERIKKHECISAKSKTECWDEHMIQWRESKYKEYVALVDQFPVVNNITAREPDFQSVFAAATAVKNTAISEKTKLEFAKEDLGRRSPKDALPLSYLDYMSYSNFVLDLVEEKPEYCGVAADLYKTIQKRGTVKKYAFNGLLAASFVVFVPGGAAVGTAAGVAAGAAYIGSLTSDYNKYKLHQSITQSEVLQSVGSGSQLGEQKYELHKGVMLAPLVVFGAAKLPKLSGGKAIPPAQ